MASHSDLTTAGKLALVTGIGGFTGRYVRDVLTANGFDVIGTDTSRAAPSPYDDRVLDTRSLAACRALIDELRPSHIVHLAARSFVGQADDDLGFYDVNVIGTLNLLRACADVRPTPQQILIASSANIYGNTAGVIDESTLPTPVNHYGASKLAMEHLVRTWMDHFPIVITRPFNYTGRNQSERFLIAKIVAHFRDRKAKIELGNLDVARDFSDVRYVADVYKSLLSNSGIAGQTLNVCSGQAYSLSEILDFCREITQHEIEVRVNPNFVRDNEIKFLAGNPKKLQSLVPSVKPIPFKSTLEWMIEAQ